MSTSWAATAGDIVGAAVQGRILAWVARISATRWAVPCLALISFANSSLFPVTPTVLLVPMALADRGRAMRLAHVCLVSSVAGGFVGLVIGRFFMDTLGAQFVRFYGIEGEYALMRHWFAEWGGWAVALAGFTPAPYKVFALTAGALHMDLPSFLAASIVNRGLRFYMVALPIRYYGDRMLSLLEERRGLVFGFVALALAVLFAVRRLLG